MFESNMNMFENSTTPEVSFTLEEIRDKLLESPIYALDLETTSLDLDGRITIVSLATRESSWAIETRLFPLAEIARVLAPVFNSASKVVVLHNADFDIKYLNRNGVYIKNLLADTMILSWLFREDPHNTSLKSSDGKLISKGHGLKHLVRKYLNHQMESYDQARSLFGDFNSYATNDSKYTLELFDWLMSQLTEREKKWFWEVEMSITQVIIEMETRGVRLDPKQLKKLKRKSYEYLEILYKRAHKLVGYEFEVTSAEKCGKALFDKLKIGDLGNGINRFSERGIPKGKNSLGPWSTSDEVLTEMRRCSDLDKKSRLIVRILLKVREVGTRLNTFIKPLLDRARENEIIHPSFLQIGTKTGRFSSRDPNFQNLPKVGGVRTAFISRKGYVFIRADYSQAELRFMAHMSKDPTMLNIYRNNGDIHTTTAKACGVSRQAAKAINFGFIYRMSAKTLQAQLAFEGIIISLEDAKSYMKKYFTQYSYVRRFHNQVDKAVIDRLKKNGEFGYINTIGGRTRRLEKEYLTNNETGYTAVTQLINATIQGGVSDLIKFAMKRIQNEFKLRGWLNPEKGIWDAYLFNQIHDELCIEAKAEIADEVAGVVKEAMEYAGKHYKIIVPMVAETSIVNNLGEK